MFTHMCYYKQYRANFQSALTDEISLHDIYVCELVDDPYDETSIHILTNYLTSWPFK